MRNIRTMQCEGITEKVLQSGLSVRIRSRGASMFPTLSTGDRVIVSDACPMLRGDIIVFRKDALLICHRLVRISRHGGVLYYETRGDAVFGTDEPILPEQVIGKVVSIERERVSPVRRIFLLLYPLLNFLRLNAAAVRLAVDIRELFRRAS